MRGAEDAGKKVTLTCGAGLAARGKGDARAGAGWGAGAGWWGQARGELGAHAGPACVAGRAGDGGPGGWKQMGCGKERRWVGPVGLGWCWVDFGCGFVFYFSLSNSKSIKHI